MSAYIKRLFVVVLCRSPVWLNGLQKHQNKGLGGFLFDIYTFVDFILFCFVFFSSTCTYMKRGGGKDVWKHMENVIKIKILTFQFFGELSGLFKNFIIKD